MRILKDKVIFSPGDVVVAMVARSKTGLQKMADGKLECNPSFMRAARRMLKKMDGLDITQMLREAIRNDEIKQINKFSAFMK